MIPPGEIARLAHRLRLGDKTIEQDYVLTWVESVFQEDAQLLMHYDNA